MDELKKYLQQNREELDTDIPRDRLWQQIRQRSAKKKIPVRSLIRYAAAASILALIVLSVRWLTKSEAKKPVVESFANTSAKQLVKVLVDQPAATDPGIIEARTSITKTGSKKVPAENMYDLVNALGRSYAEVVQLQLKSIRTTALYADEPGYFDVFKTELRQMDEVELAIRNFIKQNGPDDKLLEQLINVYQHKLDLLKTLRVEMSKLNSRANQNRPSADSSKAFYLDI